MMWSRCGAGVEQVWTGYGDSMEMLFGCVFLNFLPTHPSFQIYFVPLSLLEKRIIHKKDRIWKQ